MSATSFYRTAIDETALTLQRRAAWFRNHIVATVVVAGGLISAALISSLPILAGLAVLVPVSGVFIIVDDLLLRRWRSALMNQWVLCSLDFFAFRHAMRAHPGIPHQSLEGMLATLPSAGDLVGEQAVRTPTRRAIAAQWMYLQGGRSAALLLKVIAAVIIVAAGLAAIWSRVWLPLVALTALAGLPVMAMMLERHRRAQRDRDLQWSRAQIEFTETDFVRLCAAIRL